MCIESMYPEMCFFVFTSTHKVAAILCRIRKLYISTRYITVDCKLKSMATTYGSVLGWRLLSSTGLSFNSLRFLNFKALGQILLGLYYSNPMCQ